MNDRLQEKLRRTLQQAELYLDHALDSVDENDFRAAAKDCMGELQKAIVSLSSAAGEEVVR